MNYFLIIFIFTYITCLTCLQHPSVAFTNINTRELNRNAASYSDILTNENYFNYLTEQYVIYSTLEFIYAIFTFSLFFFIKQFVI